MNESSETANLARNLPPVTSTLDDSLAAHDIELPAVQREKLNQYCERLWSWNERINLTRHLDYDTFVARDVLDTVQLSKLIEPKERVLDIGSGGGVPGVVLAILRPDVIVTVCDSIAKKTAALEDIVAHLELKTKVVNNRIQDLLPKRKYDTLVARAVGSTSKILRWVAPSWSRFNRLVLIKGPRWLDERNEARHFGLLKNLELRKLAAYPMPGTESESVILGVHHKSKDATNQDTSDPDSK